MHEMSTCAPDVMINLLPFETKKELRRLYAMRTLTVSLFAATGFLVVMIALALPSFFVLTYGEPRSYGQTGEKSVPQKSSLKFAKEMVDDINAKTRLLLPPARAYRSILPTEAFAVLDRAFMDAATNTLQRKIILQDVAYSMNAGAKNNIEDVQSTVIIRGIANDRESLRRFIGALEADAAIKGVTSPIANFLTDKELQFTLDITFAPQ